MFVAALREPDRPTSDRHRNPPAPPPPEKTQAARSPPEASLRGYRQAPSDSGVAAAVAVIATQCRMNGDAANALGRPALDLGAMRLNGGYRATGPTGLADRRAQRRVIWQRCIGRQPALRSG